MTSPFTHHFIQNWNVRQNKTILTLIQLLKNYWFEHSNFFGAAFLVYISPQKNKNIERDPNNGRIVSRSAKPASRLHSSSMFGASTWTFHVCLTPKCLVVPRAIVNVDVAPCWTSLILFSRFFIFYYNRVILKFSDRFVVCYSFPFLLFNAAFPTNQVAIVAPT